MDVPVSQSVGWGLGMMEKSTEAPTSAQEGNVGRMGRLGGCDSDSPTSSRIPSQAPTTTPSLSIFLVLPLHSGTEGPPTPSLSPHPSKSIHLPNIQTSMRTRDSFLTCHTWSFVLSMYVCSSFDSSPPLQASYFPLI